jgi:hypothetical protein
MFPLIVTLVQQSNLWSYFGLVLNGEILKKKIYLLIAPTKTQHFPVNLSQKSTKTHVSIIYTIIKKCLIE